MRCQLMIKDGYVVDPSQNFEGKKDIYIDNGLILESSDLKPKDADYVINADGMMVFPGLIDYHTHIFYGYNEWSIDTDLNFFPQGVTSAMDAGSAGVAGISGLLKNTIGASKMDLFALVNVCTMGLGGMKIHENVDPQYWNKEKIAYYLKKYSDVLKGIKLRISKGVVQELGLEPLYKAVELGDELGVPLHVHVTDAPETQDKVIDALRPGDTYVHLYQGTGNSIIGPDGKVFEAIKKGHERGVYLDAANGKGHFHFTVVEEALREGVLPDIISTDITGPSLFKDPVFSLPYLMSKYKMLGLSLTELVERCTTNPAKILGISDRFGSLTAGHIANVSIMKLISKHVVFSDTIGKTRDGEELFVPEITISHGNIVYRNLDSL